jgi:NAD(P)-dependent dehydrogenase (short-subunit alcohol dehydrogenase family)
MVSLKNQKVVFVTGGSGGIGKEISKSLLKAGYKVAIGYKEDVKSAKIISRQSKDAIIVQIDITNRESVKKAIKKISKYFKKPIGILINNAAIAQEKPFLEISDDDWDNMLAINLKGAVICCQEILPKLIEKKYGRIINIVSIGGQWGGKNQVHYAAAKAGMINFTKSLARLYSSYRITINAVSPGLVRTKMAKKEVISKEGKEKIKDIPIGRIAMPDEIAKVVLFLCSDDSSYITGQTLNVNGGMYFN